MSGWRCLAGVGYLVVFDAIGLGVKLVGGEPGEGARSLRRPYGWVSFVVFVRTDLTYELLAHPA